MGWEWYQGSMVIAIAAVARLNIPGLESREQHPGSAEGIVLATNFKP